MVQLKLWQLLVASGKGVCRKFSALEGFPFKGKIFQQKIPPKVLRVGVKRPSLAVPKSAGTGGGRAGDLLVHLDGKELQR